MPVWHWVHMAARPSASRVCRSAAMRIQPSPPSSTCRLPGPWQASQPTMSVPGTLRPRSQWWGEWV